MPSKMPKFVHNGDNWNLEALMMTTNDDTNACPVLYDWIEMSDLLIMLHITRNTLREWSIEGELKCSRIKNRVYFLRQDIERFLYNHYQIYKP